MRLQARVTAAAGLYKGGPNLVDLLVDATELRLSVTGPRMLFERLEFVTTLSALDGCTFQRLRELADCLEGTIHCGLVGVRHADITVESIRTGGTLRIGLGPASMYQSELSLRTRTGETFRELVTRVLPSRDGRPFFAGLHAVTAEGHLEHHHDPGTGHPHHIGGHHGHA